MQERQSDVSFGNSVRPSVRLSVTLCTLSNWTCHL